jgi:hypothetical protein
MLRGTAGIVGRTCVAGVVTRVDGAETGGAAAAGARVTGRVVTGAGSYSIGAGSAAIAPNDSSDSVSVEGRAYAPSPTRSAATSRSTAGAVDGELRGVGDVVVAAFRCGCG